MSNRLFILCAVALLLSRSSVVDARESRQCERLDRVKDRYCAGDRAGSRKCQNIASRFVMKGCATTTICTADEVQTALDAGGVWIIHSSACPGSTLDVTVTSPGLTAPSASSTLICIGSCTIGGGGTSRVIEVLAGNSLALVGVNVKDGFFEGNGGCIALARGSVGTQLFLTSLKVSGCVAQGTSVDGGAIFLSRVSAGNVLTATDVIFEDNKLFDDSQGKGGAVYINGGGNAESDLPNEFYMHGGAFINNECKGPEEGIQDNCIGGGFYTGRNTYAEIDGVDFFGNRANTYGGAINTFPWGLSTDKFDPTIGRPMTLIVSNCKFKDNYAAYGAGIYASTLPIAPLDRLTFDTYNNIFLDEFDPAQYVQVCIFNSCGTDGF